MNTSNSIQPQAFSLFAGGPFFQLLRRSHLCGEGLELVLRRTLWLTLIAWLPLLVLSAAQGHALGGALEVPFLLDVETHARFLVALPLLIVAEFVVHGRIGLWVGQFPERQLIPDEAKDRFQDVMASALRLRNSATIEGLFVVLVLVFGTDLTSGGFGAIQGATWQASSVASGHVLSPAGMWLHYVSLPLFQFLLLRWYFRLLLWARFLWQMSRIELRLVPTHPDGSGGLGFLNGTIDAFMPLAVAHGALLSGVIAQRIFHRGATLPDFMAELVVIVALMLGVLLGPLLVFIPRIARAQRKGTAEYGALAARYVREFDGKWLRGGASPDEPLIGNPDIQSLADMSNSFQVVRQMNIALVTKQAIARLLVYTLLPVVPLLLTMMPLEALLNKVFGILF